MSDQPAVDDQPATEVFDPTDPAYWARPEFAIKAPKVPPMHSKLSCVKCLEGTAYYDGTGGYHCFKCGWVT